MTVEKQLPIADISCFISPSSYDDAARKACINTVNEACADKGFFQLIGHGVPQSLMAVVFEQTAQFFSLPLAEKQRLDKTLAPAPRSHRGYEVIGGQMLEENTNPDLKEGYFYGEEHSMEDPRVKAGTINHGPNQWPDETKLPQFKPIMMEYFAKLRELSSVVMKVLALSLRVHEDYFEEFNINPIATCRLLHYPPQPPNSDPLMRGAGKHTDFVTTP